MVRVIVDCQVLLRPVRPVLEAIEGEIRDAMAKDEPIVMLRYFTGGEIYEHILDLLRGYDKHVVVTKRTFGGATSHRRVLRSRFGT